MNYVLWGKTGITSSSSRLLPSIPSASAQSRTAAPSAPISIVSPANNALLSYSPTIRGTTQASSGQKIWVIVYDYKVGRYYPQEGPIAPSNGEWSTSAYLGTAVAGIGEKFDITAVIANENAHTAFEQYQANSKQTFNYPGMTSLPSGIIAQDLITVERTS